MSDTLVEVKGLRKSFPITRGIIKRRVVGEIPAVDGVDLSIPRHKTIALVGESGCGKSTTGRLILRLLDPTAGHILFDGADVATAQGADLRALRRRFQMIFQDPFGSLNPRMRVLDLVGEPMRFAGAGRGERIERAREMMAASGLGPQFEARYPHELSGGQRQRIGIARALVLKPELIVADEPVSALDVSIQAQVVNLMQDLQQQLGLTYLFISHDLGIVHHIADRVAVMYLGKIVEVADKADLFRSPAHPYTRALMSAIPASRPGLRRGGVPALTGELSEPTADKQGCKFAPRCPFATDRCRAEEPALRVLDGSHAAACHRSEELAEAPATGA